MKQSLVQMSSAKRHLIASASLLAFGSAFAQQGPVMTGKDMEVHLDALTAARATVEYWTPERMKAAKAKPFPSVFIRGAEVNALADITSDLIPGGARGWNARGAPPDANAGIQLEMSDAQMGTLDLPQTTPPFSPPATPADFGNYAPFNRWTWQQANNTVYPISTVGKLFFTQRGVNFVCSASVIHRSTLATAGHCVHDGSNSVAGWSTNVLFCPSANPVSNPRGCWPGGVMSTSFQWFSARNIDRDYGCIVTRTTGTTIANRVGNVTGWLGRAWNWPTRQATFAFGYPAGAPFTGNRLIAVASTEWYQLNRNTSESQLSKYIGNDMTGGSSGGPWWINHTHSGTEIADTDASQITDPGTGSAPWLNGVNSHKRCTASGCPVGTVFTQEMGSPQFRNTAGDINESEDVFTVCFNNGGML